MSNFLKVRVRKYQSHILNSGSHSSSLRSKLQYCQIGSIIDSRIYTSSYSILGHWFTKYCQAISVTIYIYTIYIYIGGGNGNPLQYSCLENPRDRGAWWAALYGVAQSWTRLKRLNSSGSRNTHTHTQTHTHTHILYIYTHICFIYIYIYTHPYS